MSKTSLCRRAFMLFSIITIVQGQSRCKGAPWKWCDKSKMHETAIEQGAKAYSGLNQAKNKEEVAIRCTTPRRGFLRLRRHHTLGKALFEEAVISEVPSPEAKWQVLRLNKTHVRLMQSAGDFLAMKAGTDNKMPYMLTTTKEMTSNISLFRLEERNEHIPEKKDKASSWHSVRLFNVGASAYVNCVKAGAIRGHSIGNTKQASTAAEPSTQLELLHAPFIDETKTHDLNIDLDCERVCRGDAAIPLEAKTNINLTTFPPIAKGSDFNCPSRFRDISDWVFSWPFEHFGEKAWTASLNSFVRCTTVPIVYSHANTLYKIPAFAKRLKQPFILLSGQSDFPVSRSRQLLSEPLLLKWYAQNADIKHQKLVQLPIGLNCFEHAMAMTRALGPSRKTKAAASAPKTKLLWVNFASTHPRRRIAWTHFCKLDFKPVAKSQPNKNSGRPHDPSPPHHSLLWLNAPQADRATCYVKSSMGPAITKSDFVHTPVGDSVNNLAGHYRLMAQHKYVAAPRGNGLDTHRFWEALYLGCIPIVESSALDALYSAAGALIVKDWTQVTPQLLNARYPEYRARVQNATHLLSPEYWIRQIESVRYQSAISRKIVKASAASLSRHRCWGRKS